MICLSVEMLRNVPKVEGDFRAGISKGFIQN